MKHKKKMIGMIMLIMGLLVVMALRNKEVPQSQGLVTATECPSATFSTTCAAIVKLTDVGGDPQMCRDTAAFNCRADCMGQITRVCAALCQGTPGCYSSIEYEEITGCVGQGPDAGICTAAGSDIAICKCLPVNG